MTILACARRTLPWKCTGTKTHMFNTPDAADVLPSKRNHGLNPSDDFAAIILQSCAIALRVFRETIWDSTHLWEV